MAYRDPYDPRRIIKDHTYLNTERGYVLNDLPEDDPQRRCPVIDRATRELGWKPIIPLTEGLIPTIEWFQRCLNERN